MQCKGKKTIQLANGQDSQQLCLNTHFQTRGFDKHHKALPQVLECKNCGKRCYPHTSYEFQDKATEIVRNLLSATFEDHQPLLGQESVVHFSMSILSQIGQDFKNYITNLCTSHSNKDLDTFLQTPPVLPYMFSSAF